MSQMSIQEVSSPPEYARSTRPLEPAAADEVSLKVIILICSLNSSVPLFVKSREWFNFVTKRHIARHMTIVIGRGSRCKVMYMQVRFIQRWVGLHT